MKNVLLFLLCMSEADSVYSIVLNDENIESLIGIKEFSNLLALQCRKLSIQELDVSGLSDLMKLTINENSQVSMKAVKAISCSSLMELEILSVNIDTIDLSGCATVTRVLLTDCDFNDLRIQDCAALSRLRIDNVGSTNEIRLVLENFLELETVGLIGVFPELTLANLPKLHTFSASLGSVNTVFNIDPLPELIRLALYNCRVVNDLEIADFPRLDVLRFGGTYATSITIRDNPKLRLMEHGSSPVWPIDYILTGLPALEELKFFGIAFEDLKMSDLPKLTSLDITELSIASDGRLDISQLTGLVSVDLREVELRSFICKRLPNLTDIQIIGKVTDTVIVNSMPIAEKIHMELEGQTVYMDISENIAMINPWSTISEVLVIPHHVLDLNMRGSTSLRYLDIRGKVDRLNLTGLTSLESIRYRGGTTILDFSTCVSLDYIYINDAPSLEILAIKNGRTQEIEWDLDSPLREICADFSELDTSIDSLMQHYPELTLFTDCPILEPQNFYVLNGGSLYDINNDSCRTSEVQLAHSRYYLRKEGGAKSYYFANFEGDYIQYLTKGDYTFGPEVLYGEDLFTILPSQITVSLSDSIPVVNQDFCYLSTQDLDIVDVTLIPIDNARPGFESAYRIVYTNTGSVIKDGDITLQFQEDVLDFVSSIPDITTQEEGFLSWSFEGLVPYETRTIDFYLLPNTPMDTPPVNGGDLLDFTAQVAPIGNVTTTAYWSYLTQEVVNSFDPNDKRCLNGEILDPDDVGEYLKYMIRFENTGTADAINVFVTDTLDESVYDIRSLEVLSASHAVRTEQEGNVVKFFFDEIYLPFEDATNDGYVVFRIKTLPTLELGDLIENKAAIYFDFNFPIITNTATTEVKVITNTSNVAAGMGLAVFPNPTHSAVRLSSDVPIYEVTVSDYSGRLLYSSYKDVPTSEITIDFSGYAAGVYVLKTVGLHTSQIVKVAVQ